MLAPSPLPAQAHQKPKSGKSFPLEDSAASSCPVHLGSLHSNCLENLKQDVQNERMYAVLLYMLSTVKSIYENQIKMTECMCELRDRAVYIYQA